VDPLDRPLEEAFLTILDVETTGLEPEDRITEIAALRLRGVREVGRFHSLVNPGIHIPPTAAAISGIDDETVSAAPAFAEIWPAVERLLAEAVLVAHNAPFDLHFLSAERKRAGLGGWKGPVLDTLRLTRNVFTLPSYSLASLGRALRLEHAPSHRAMADVMATTALLRRLLEALGERTPTVRALLAAQEPVPVPWDQVGRCGLPKEEGRLLAQAAADARPITLEYEGRNGPRRFRLRPVEIVSNGPLFYLRAAMTLKGDEPGLFRIDRIRALSTEAEP